MALRKILTVPDPRLHKVATSVVTIDDEIRQLIDDMFETMYDAPGIGLAATQIDIHLRVIVIDVSEDKTEPYVFINPEILNSTGVETMQEGCLSVPTVYEEVTRADKVKVSALNREGETFELEADGLLAVCIQHEIDHLNGKVFLEHLSSLKRVRLMKKLEKLKKREG